MYRINPSEGEGVNLTVKSGQKHNKYSHERSSPSSRNDWLNKHKQHEPCRIRSQLYVQSFGLKSFRAGHDQLILQIQGGVLWFSPFFSFFFLLKSLQLGVKKKSHILLPGLVFALVATPKPHNILTIPHLKYF